MILGRTSAVPPAGNGTTIPDGPVRIVRWSARGGCLLHAAALRGDEAKRGGEQHTRNRSLERRLHIQRRRYSDHCFLPCAHCCCVSVSPEGTNGSAKNWSS